MDEQIRSDPQDVIADGGWGERGSVGFAGVRID